MCAPMLIPALAGVFGGGATATGATAAAGVGLGKVLSIAGTLASVAGQVTQGRAAAQAAEMQVEQIEAQRRTEAELNAVREERARARFKSAMGTQRAQLAGRGVSLDSPTAVLLGQSAAAEMSYETQAIRGAGQARDAELSGAQAQLRARGTEALFKGGFAAASTLLNRAPKLWPELLA